MSAQELQRLQNDAEGNPELKASIAQAVSEATDAAGASAALKACGYDVTEEDLQAVKAMELNDDALDSVAGGTGFGQNSFLELVFPEYAHDL
ncbi:Nif11-like leader peptide family RiPP precursor [Azospirillum sp. SYSU D00513]|uniref:Nif11-like leader peptide family RiPP precursor n=1 Tax=Azospirillum sp. SYSU D00513 TaxID=2812561 RepID=UPI001A96FE63|nr:Nif11-like leader peptide family RiPP precursor [Azospirillum sp. SYSU D00513]